MELIVVFENCLRNSVDRHHHHQAGRGRCQGATPPAGQIADRDSNMWTSFHHAKPGNKLDVKSSCEAFQDGFPLSSCGSAEGDPPRQCRLLPVLLIAGSRVAEDCPFLREIYGQGEIGCRGAFLITR